MASYQKRGKTWQYTVSHYVDGKLDPIRKGGFRTKPEAIAAATEIEHQLRKGHVSITKNIPFSDYFKEWVDLYKKGRHKTTYERYKNSVARVKDYFKDLPIQKIKSNHYQKFLNEYGKGKSKETVRKLNTHIRGCVKDAIEEGYISVDFTRKAEFNASKSAKKGVEKHLDFEEATTLYDSLLVTVSQDSTTPYLLPLGLVTGFRYGELVGLTTDKFDFDTNTIKVDRSWDYKGDTGFGPLKNTQSERRIKVDSTVIEAFKKLFNSLLKCPHDLVFYSPQSNVTVLTNEGANKALKATLEQLKLKSITIGMG